MHTSLSGVLCILSMVALSYSLMTFQCVWVCEVQCGPKGCKSVCRCKPSNRLQAVDAGFELPNVAGLASFGNSLDGGVSECAKAGLI
ncbi:MAG: hypothetical protein KME03_14945 [Aphanocapsa lilacina HA4352-LM1]|jgi:hypothetical protein|nr:hypothetical protein [Aphanocapsa lilacina HA4352-LM1]